jgi:hypothetical protein
MWRPTKADWKFFKGYTYLWEFGFRHVVWLNERLLETLLGIEGRYKLQMRHFLNLNNFGIVMNHHEGHVPYHPAFGTDTDPYDDTRSSVLSKPLSIIKSPRQVGRGGQ